jgi:hypothetical protein
MQQTKMQMCAVPTTKPKAASTHRQDQKLCAKALQVLPVVPHAAF